MVCVRSRLKVCMKKKTKWEVVSPVVPKVRVSRTFKGFIFQFPFPRHFVFHFSLYLLIFSLKSEKFVFIVIQNIR